MNSIKVGILSDPKSWHSQKLQVAFASRQISPHYFSSTRLQVRLGSQWQVSSVETSLNELDLLLVRDVPGGSLEQIIYRMDALHQIEDGGVRVVNRPGAIEKMVDKYYTSSLLAGAGLPVPETIVTERIEEAIQAFELLGGDVVVKPLFGSQGVGMVRLTDREVAWRTFRALEMGHYVFYLQQFIPHNNHDIRVFIIGGDCAAAMLRQSVDWKSNLSQGATPLPFEPSTEMVALCRIAAQVVGADYCGIDLLPAENGKLYLSEINSMLSWKGLQSVCKVDLADKLVAFLLGLLKH